MSKLSSKSIEWLKDAEQKYIVNMPEVTEENRSRVKFMQDGLKAVQEELAMRLIQQKKSEMQPVAQNEQLPDREAQIERENKAAWFAERQAQSKQLEVDLKEIAKQEWPKIKARLDEIEPIPILPSDLQSAQSVLDKYTKNEAETRILAKIESEQQKNVYRQALEKVPQQVKQFVQNEAETRILGKIENPEPIAVPVVEMDFKDVKGNIYTRKLTQTDIISLLKTYFKRVATSAGMESGRYSNTYSSNMGKTVYKLFKGWNTIYNETQEGAAWPPLEDCFPGFGRASQNQKVNAQILWRWASKK